MDLWIVQKKFEHGTLHNTTHRHMLWRTIFFEWNSFDIVLLLLREHSRTPYYSDVFVHFQYLAFPIYQFFSLKRIDTSRKWPAETFNIRNSQMKNPTIVIFFSMPIFFHWKYYCLFSINIQLIGSTLSRKFSFYYLFSVLDVEWMDLSK